MDKIHSIEREFTVLTRLTAGHITDLMRLYDGEFWCNTRTRDDVERMLGNTDVVIGLQNTDSQLIGFCRVLTDFVYKATLYDVIVDSRYRGQGLGDYLLKLVVEDPRLSGVGHIDLNCLPAMTAFYHRWNFSEDLDCLCHMRRHQRES